MDSYEHENARLREELAALRDESERSRTETENLRSMVTTLLATQSQPFSTQGATIVAAPIPTVSAGVSQLIMPKEYTWGMPTGVGKETHPFAPEIPTAIPHMIPILPPEGVVSNNQMDELQKRLDEMQRELKTLRGKDLSSQETPELCLVPDDGKTPFNFDSHLQSLVQTHMMDQLEQEVCELREEVMKLRAEIEKLTSLVSSPIVKKDQPQAQQEPQLLCQSLRQQQPRLQAPRTQFEPIPMKYAELLPLLLERNLVWTKAPLPVPGNSPVGNKAGFSCAFHQGAPGHDEEHCFALKKAVHKLIQANILSFKDLNPNVQSNA